MKNPSLHERSGRALIVSSLVILALAIAACDNAAVSTPSPIGSAVKLSSSIATLTPLSGASCPGLAFGASVSVVIASGPQDLTMQSLTVHLIDGSNAGGPMVTMPSPQLNAQFGTTIVRAGTSRGFLVQPVFGCISSRPHAIGITALVMDQRGAQQTLNATSEVR